MTSPRTSVDEAEIEKFSALANEWWNPNGKFRPLHKFNPVRLEYIIENLCRHFGRTQKQTTPLSGLNILDIGCGGGLLCEPLARLGASVTGIDASEKNVKVATLHAQKSGLSIAYRHITAEALAQTGAQFDTVLCMEVVEHVADVSFFLEACARMVGENGLVFVATINRTPKAFVFAILGAEYVLRWLPRGTHSYEKLVRPDEIRVPLEANAMRIIDQTGVSYNPITDQWRCSGDMAVNYMLLAERPAQLQKAEKI